MAELCNHYVFSDVDSPQSFLTNIKNVAVSNGWVCDKDDINDNWELYLHSNHGGRNLYYSMRIEHNWHCSSEYDYWSLRLYGNLGFDDTKAVNEQPGRWANSCSADGNSKERYKLFFPLLNQYIIASEQVIFVFSDFYKSVIHLSVGNFPNRLITAFAFGGIDLYNEDETEGNFLVHDGNRSWYDPYCSHPEESLSYLASSFFGVYWSPFYDCFSLLYNGVNKADENFGISTVRCIWYDPDRREIAYNDIDHGKQGFKYRDGVRWNEWCSRTTMLKPIVSIYYEDAENEYFFPIGELPYYSCCVWPRAKAGDVLTFGSRKFIVFPLISYTETYGIAIEVNP